ncbi:unnamed protein product [Staurois parvus]|uniref:Uncharacterized protein n=1 Tax=Staurois parvus TaxID=386267 RepID=A0ABN9DCB9_9NEOB|nr:unnamed protein product [Staurois parvus]
MTTVETADILQGMTRDCGTQYTEMTRDCGHSTGYDQRLRTQYRGLPKTADTVQEMTRDCGHSTGDDQRLWT